MTAPTAADYALVQKYDCSGGLVNQEDAAQAVAELRAEMQAKLELQAFDAAKVCAEVQLALESDIHHLQAKLDAERKLADALAEFITLSRWVQPSYNGSPSCSGCGEQKHLHTALCETDDLLAAYAAARKEG